MNKVFISHATSDRELVETAIVTLLNRHGITTWYAKEQISTGVQWEKKIREGLESCDWFLVALTPRAIASEWVRSETDWAIENRAGRIVPVVLERCDPGQLHLRLRLLQFVDFQKRGEEEKMQLLGAWDIRPEAIPTPQRDRLPTSLASTTISTPDRRTGTVFFAVGHATKVTTTIFASDAISYARLPAARRR